MSKKRLIALIVFFAYSFILGHDIVPHHHHSSGKDHQHHHDGHEHAHSSPAAESTQDTPDGLQNIFSGFLHPTGGYTFIPVNIINTDFRMLQIPADLPGCFSIDFPPEPVLFVFSLAEDSPVQAPYSHPQGLRAPPAAFV